MNTRLIAMCQRNVLVRTNNVDLSALRGFPDAELQFNEYGDGDPVLPLAQIRREPRHERSQRKHVPAGRRYAARSRKIRNVRSAMIVLETPGEILPGHVVERGGSVPGFVLVAWILGEVGSPGERRRAVDR